MHQVKVFPSSQLLQGKMFIIQLQLRVASRVLNMNVLSIAVVNRSDVFTTDDPDYSPSGYRKAAYRQWVLWIHGYLGRANIPSCVVWAVQYRYPAPDGQYLGFKEY